MLFRYALTVPANTTEASPTTSIVAVTYGVLREVSVSFPPGAAALTHVAVQYHEFQIIPLSPGTYLAWDDLTLSWSEEIPLFTPPFELRLVGWNEDDTFAHTVTFQFNILPPRMDRAGALVQRLFGTLPGFGEL